MRANLGQVTLRVPRNLTWAVGLAMVASGLLLLLGVGAYHAYAAVARSRLDRLNFTVEAAQSAVGGPGASAQGPAAMYDPPPATRGRPAQPPRTETLPTPAGRVATDAGPAPSSFSTIYPGLQIHPKYWDKPLWAGPDPYLLPALPEGYLPRSADADGAAPGAGFPATRIAIPLVGIDATVADLKILDLGDSRAYETPNQVVGHIPRTINPGEKGNGWFFGHLESLIRREGNVFQQLPKIPGLLKDGDPVYVSLYSNEGEFLYQVTSTKVVHQSELSLYPADGATITLVTCVPRFVYDYRLLVTAKLVGFRG